MDYSVIIPTCNRKKELGDALESLVRQSVLPREVIVIDQSDNAETKELCDALQAKHAQVKIVYIYREEKGSARARNAGIAVAEGDVVGFLDDDVVLYEDYFEVVLGRFAADPAVGGVGGAIVDVDIPRTWKWPIRKALYRGLLINDFKGGITASGFGYPIFDGDVDREMEVKCFCGSNMSFRRELLRDDQFDPWFTGYSYREDVELSYRISRKAKLVLIPGARLEHHHTPSARMKYGAARAMEMTNNYYIYKKLVRKGLLTDALFIYSVAGLMGIALVELATQRSPKSVEGLKGYVDGLVACFTTADGRVPRR
jgi:GT2 family glycosyltransferase